MNLAGSISLMLICSLSVSAAEDASKVDAPGEPKLLAEIRSFEVNAFGQASPDDSIDKRIDALETKLFGRPFAGSLFERMDNIRRQLNKKSSEPAVVDTQAYKKVDKKDSPDQTVQIKVEQLQKIQTAFEANDLKLARKLATDFIEGYPFDHNGYYALGQIDIKEKAATPEYDQYAFNQFLKAYYLAPGNKLCEYAFAYVQDLKKNERRNDPKCVVTTDYYQSSPQALLNVGVGCFKRDQEQEAIDLFKFVTKFPAGAASGYYNLGAIEESHGRLAAAKKQYDNAEKAYQKRAQIQRSGLLKASEVDPLSEKLIARTTQRLSIKIKSGDKKWQGLVPTKLGGPTRRCTINRMADDELTDARDAGAPFEQ